MTPWRRHSYAKAMQIPPNGWPRHLRHQYHHHQQQQHDHQSHHHNHHHISFTTLLQGHFRADNCTRKSTAKKDSMDISVGSVNINVFPSLCDCQYHHHHDLHISGIPANAWGWPVCVYLIRASRAHSFRSRWVLLALAITQLLGEEYPVGITRGDHRVGGYYTHSEDTW